MWIFGDGLWEPSLSILSSGRWGEGTVVSHGGKGGQGYNFGEYTYILSNIPRIYLEYT